MTEEQRNEMYRQAEKKVRIIRLFHTERLADTEREEETAKMFEEVLESWRKCQARKEADEC